MMMHTGISTFCRRARSYMISVAILFQDTLNVLDLSTHFLFFFVRGLRSRALGVGSGPRGGGFEGVLDPLKK